MFNKKTILGDIFGGLTASVVALPLALAFGVQSGMGAIAGLYGAIALGILASLFGGTKTQISGPTGPMVVVASAVIATEVAIYGSLEKAFATIIATFVLAGILQILMGLSGVGKYIRYMPYPVVSGFMSGIGLIIIALQIFPFFGDKSPLNVVDIVTSLDKININFEAMYLSSATIFIIYFFPKLTKKVPSSLVALIVLTIVAIVLKIDVPIIGDIPKGFPEVHIDTLLGLDWHHPMNMIIPALTLASLATIDSLLTSVVADNKTKTKHNSNKELIGQGIGNVVAGMIGGLPGAGATVRTVVNIDSGGRTQLSGLIHGVILLIILLGAGEYAKLIPIPVLAGILVMVGIGIVDYRGLKHIFKVPKSEAIIMIVVLVLTTFVDLLQAVAVGMVMASLLFMKTMGDIAQNKTYGMSFAKDTQKIIQMKDDSKIDIYIQLFNGPIFFGFTSYFTDIISKLPTVNGVAFNMKNVPYIDQSGLYALEDAILELNTKKIPVYFVGLNKQVEDMFRKIVLIPNLVEEKALYLNIKTFEKGLKIKNNCSIVD